MSKKPVILNLFKQIIGFLSFFFLSKLVLSYHTNISEAFVPTLVRETGVSKHLALLKLVQFSPGGCVGWMYNTATF